MALVVSSMAAILWIGGSGLVVPAPAPSPVPLEPPPGMPITDPARPPVFMGLGHEPDVQAAFNTPTVLFVNFDGPFMNAGCGNNSQNDCSQIFPNVQFQPHPGSDVTRAAVIQATRKDVEDFGVIVVGERPPAGNPYAMVVSGVPSSGAPNGVGGVAPGIDCGNTNPNITSFNFLVSASANIQATVIHQEAAHTWGLEHVDDDSDNLFPSTGGVVDPKYRDTCSRIVADVQLNPTSASCNSVHTMFCQSNFQNSYQEMLLLFGPPVPDVIAPSVVIEAPTEGEVIDYAANFDLTITLTDDRRPQVLGTTIYFDDVEAGAGSFIDTTLTFPVTGGDPPMGHGLSNGPHTIRVDITDEAGNPASASVTFEIAGAPVVDADDSGGSEAGGSSSEGGEPPAETGDATGQPLTGPELDRDADEGCACRTGTGGPRWGAGAGLLALLVVGLRRRQS
jgi:MYXO-CTERM domain-containing protein